MSKELLRRILAAEAAIPASQFLQEVSEFPKEMALFRAAFALAKKDGYDKIYLIERTASPSDESQERSPDFGGYLDRPGAITTIRPDKFYSLGNSWLSPVRDFISNFVAQETLDVISLTDAF